MTALSGNNAGNGSNNSIMKAPQHAEVSAQELQEFLVAVDGMTPEQLANDFETAADALVSTQPKKFKGGQIRAVSEDESQERASLSADAILSVAATTPTGATVISTLDITPNVIEALSGLNLIRLSTVHQKLANFAMTLQRTHGAKNFYTPPAAEFCGTYGFLDPLLLGNYVPYVEEIIDLSDDQIESCFHPLHLVDGYPCVGGVSVWERQEWERLEYYGAFKLFRDMRYAFYNDVDALLTTRSLKVLAQAIRVPTNLLHYLSKVYQWDLRCQFYDAWMSAIQQRRKAVKRSLMLDRHEKISQSLVTKAFQCLSKQADKMSAKDALQMLELGLEYERLSAGLQKDKPELLEGNSSERNAPLISINTQTNNTTGPMQVNNEGGAQRTFGENVKKPDTVLGILNVLQRSGAFDTILQKAAIEAGEIEQGDVVLDVSAEEGDAK